MRSTFEEGYETEIRVFDLAKLHENRNSWGKRSASPLVPENSNSTWEFLWYAKGAYSLPHYHPKSESVYIIDFPGQPFGTGKARAFLGWPFSKAKVIEVSTPTLLLIPAFQVHTFSNDGDVEMFLLHTFSPPWEKDLHQSSDVYDVMTNEYFTDISKYSQYAREMAEKYDDIEDLIQDCKEKGIY